MQLQIKGVSCCLRLLAYHGGTTTGLKKKQQHSDEFEAYFKLQK